MDRVDQNDSAYDYAAICDALDVLSRRPDFADCASTIFSIISSGRGNACRRFTSPDNGLTWTISRISHKPRRFNFNQAAS